MLNIYNKLKTPIKFSYQFKQEIIGIFIDIKYKFIEKIVCFRLTYFSIFQNSSLFVKSIKNNSKQLIFINNFIMKL